MTFKGPQQVITNGNMSGNLTSLVTIMDQLLMISYSIVWTGSTPVGTVSIQVSDDYSINPDGTTRNTGTWNTLPLSASTDISGNSGNGFIDVAANAGYAIRLVYTRTSGTGTLNVLIMGK